jgi:hypothetical protein
VSTKRIAAIGGVAIVGFAAFAIAADVWDFGIEPITVLTIGLVAVTAFYALQNLSMAESMRTQTEQFRAADAARQREAQILDIQPFLADKPIVDFGAPSRMAWPLLARDRPVLHLTATLRAMAESPDPGSVDGRSSISRGLGSHPPQGKARAYYELDRFLRPGTHIPFEDTWEMELTYRGILDQWVVETYRWRVSEDFKASKQHWWHLSRLQIQTSVAGAPAMNQAFEE